MTEHDPTPRHHRDRDRGGLVVLAAAVAFTVVLTLVMRAVVDRHDSEPEEDATPAMATDLVPPLLAILG